MLSAIAQYSLKDSSASKPVTSDRNLRRDRAAQDPHSRVVDPRDAADRLSAAHDLDRLLGRSACCAILIAR
jgi:hypothetical protein